MAVSSVTPRKQYVATSGQTDFSIPFKWFADEDIKAYLTPAGEDPEEPRDNLVLNVDYTLTGTGDDNGGTLTLASAASENDLITIERDSIGDRPETDDFKVAGTFTVEQLNKNFDKLSMATQDNNMLIHKRMLLYPAVDTTVDDEDLILPKLENGYIWKKNDNGKLIAAYLDENADCSTLRSELASQSATTPGTSIIGHYPSQLSSGETLETFLNRVDLDLRTDLADDSQANAGSKLIGHYNEHDSISTTVYDELQSITSRTGRVPFFGFRLSNGSADPDNDITISNGECTERGGDSIIRASSGMTKRADASWVAGDNNGGMASTVTFAADSYYYVFVIMKDDGTIDFGFDNSLTATNLLADASGYTHYRRIGSFVTRSTGEIFSFIEFLSSGYKRIVLNVDALDTTEAELAVGTPVSGSPHTVNLKHLPVGEMIEANIKVINTNIYGGGGSYMLRVYSDTYTNPSIAISVEARIGLDCCCISETEAFYSQEKLLLPVSNAKIYIECMTFAGTVDNDNRLDVYTLGWNDHIEQDEFV